MLLTVSAYTFNCVEHTLGTGTTRDSWKAYIKALHVKKRFRTYTKRGKNVLRVL